MAVVRRRPVPTSKDNVKKEEVKAVETTVEETVEVQDEPVKETKKPVTKKATTKKVESKGEEKMAKVTTTKKATTTKNAVATKPATTKNAVATKPATTKKAVAPKAAAAKNLDLSRKVAEPKEYTIDENGSLKRDELIYFLKDNLANAVDEEGKVLYGIELGTLENASRVIKCFEEILREALEKSNTVHLCGRNFNRKKVKARVFNPPIGDGAYLVLPHFKMTYVLENSEKIKGVVGEDGNFVAEDGTVYTQDDLVAMDNEFFGEE